MKKIVAVVILVLILLVSAIFFVACNNQAPVSTGDFLVDVANIRNAPKGLPSLIDEDMQAIIDRGLAEGATEDEKKDAVMLLYTVANESRINAAKSLMVQDSLGGNAMGRVVMHGFTLQSGDAWYYQLVSQAVKGDVAGFEIFATMLGSIAGNLQVAYTSGDGSYYYAYIMGTDTQLDCSLQTFPYATYIIPTGSEPLKYDSFEAYQEKRNCLFSQLELNNMYVCRELLADGVTISLNQDAKGQKYYSISFDIDCENGDPELMARFIAMSKKDLANVPTIKIDHTISGWRAELDIWQDGYAKSFTSYEEWQMKVLGMSVASSPKNKFEYVWNEDEMLYILKQDQNIDPMTSHSWGLEEYIEYYSNPESVKVFNWIPVAIGVGAGLVGAIVIVIVVLAVLVKFGKLPKLALALQKMHEKSKAQRLEMKKAQAEWKEAQSQKRKNYRAAQAQRRKNYRAAKSKTRQVNKQTKKIIKAEREIEELEKYVEDLENGIDIVQQDLENK